MKNIILCALGVLCFSCTLSNKVTELKNDEESAFRKTGDINFSDSCITINKDAKIELKDKYKNFELTFECKTRKGTIGSVIFHSKNGDTSTGYEMFINNNPGTYEWRKTGGLTAIRNFGKRTFDNDSWFPIKISVIGKQIKTWSNYVPVVDYTEPNQPHREPQYTNRLLSDGHFIFMNNSDEPLQIRNITIKRFPNDTTSTSHSRNEQEDEIIKLHQRNFPTIDYHIHAKGGLSPGSAERFARSFGITYSVAPNCGLDFPITNDKQLLEWIDKNKHYPFLMPMQAEGREWTDMFSLEAISKFDYVFTDALIWRDSKGRRLRLWILEDTFIDDEQSFMDELTEVTCRIIESEPIHVLANPTYLPEALVKDYDRLWTEERMLRIIHAAVKHNIALELNNLNKIPSFKFINLAKEQGAKFTFGTNNANTDQLEKMEYLIEAINECHLSAADMFIPVSKNF